MSESTAVVTSLCVFLVIVGTCILTAILQPGIPETCLDKQRYFVVACSRNFQGDTVLKCLEKTPACQKDENAIDFDPPKTLP